jgi:cytochrome c
MKYSSIICSTVFTSTVLAASFAAANPELAKEKDCLTCHSVEKKVIGPAYKDVALKYAGQAGIEEALTRKVLRGGGGVWGTMPMPANIQVTEAEARTLVKWVLQLR